VPVDRLLSGAVYRHGEDPVRTLEGVGEARGIVEVAPADADAPLLQLPRLLRLADAYADPLGENPLEQPLHDRPAKLAVGPGDDDHSLRHSVVLAHAPSF
jgi:hypothetical protein